MDTSRARIQEYYREIKALADVAVGEWGMLALLIVVGFGSFGLGRLSALEDARPPVSIRAAPASGLSGLPLGGELIASRTGSVYYFPWCSGAEHIKPENQIWFASEKEAQSAGYSGAKSCKGLSN